jgi:hypothetical protein
MTSYPCVMPHDLTTYYSAETTWFQSFKVKYDKLEPNFASNSNLRRYTTDFTFTLNTVADPSVAAFSAGRCWLT